MTDGSDQQVDPPVRDCRFLVIPASGWPRIVPQHPRLNLISDALEGAIPVPIILPGGRTSMWVRETALAEGLDMNVAAGIIAQILSQGRQTPLFGPVVLTAVAWTQWPGEATVSGHPEGFSMRNAQKLLNAICDVQDALAGADAGFSFDLTDTSWGARVREQGAALRACPPPPGWPHTPFGEPMDEVAMLMRRLGLGQQFRPVTT